MRVAAGVGHTWKRFVVELIDNVLTLFSVVHSGESDAARLLVLITQDPYADDAAVFTELAAQVLLGHADIQIGEVQISFVLLLLLRRLDQHAHTRCRRESTEHAGGAEAYLSQLSCKAFLLQFDDRILRVFVRLEIDETKAFAAVGLFIDDCFHGLDSATATTRTATHATTPPTMTQ